MNATPEIFATHHARNLAAARQGPCRQYLSLHRVMVDGGSSSQETIIANASHN